MMTAIAIIPALPNPFEEVPVLLPDALRAVCVDEVEEEDEDRVETADAVGVIVTGG